MINFRPMASPFHAHSHFSLDGGSTIQQLVSQAKKLDQISMCLTDHGNLNGLADLHMCCGKSGLIATHGIELYIINNNWIPPKIDKNGKLKSVQKHLTVHFLNKIAYEWFCKKSIDMEQRAVTVFGEKKPILYWEELLEISQHIVLGSGCLSSFIMTVVRENNLELAEKIYCELRSSVPKNQFFVEIFPHKLTETWQKPEYDITKNFITKPGYYKTNNPDPEDPCGHAPLDVMKKPNLFVLHLAEKYGDPIVISQDVHIHEDEQWSVQNIKMGRGADSWRFSIPYSLKSSEHWYEILNQQLNISAKQMEEYIDNSYMFVDLIKNNYKFDTAKDRIILPTKEVVLGTTSELSNKEILKKLIIENGRLPKKDDPSFIEYIERLTYEVSVLADNGTIDLLPYFFVLADLVKWAKSNGRICQARGSAGGSLVAYLLGITVTDPIKWGLQFERFLTLGRLLSGNLPDIDCIDETANILLANGQTKKITELKPIEDILRDHKGEETSFIAITEKGEQECFDFVFEDRTILTATKNHLVFTDENYWMPIMECYEKRKNIKCVQ